MDSLTKIRWPREQAMPVAEEIIRAMAPACEQIVFAGSLRRGKPTVGDIEIVYVTKFVDRADPDDLFAKPIRVAQADEVIGELMRTAILEPRKNTLGRTSMGDANKLMVHLATGIPVDLFATSFTCWFNYLVCRTGGAQTNVNICNAAIARGKHWMPYGAGFKEPDGQITTMPSERAVFEHVGLSYLTPEQRP